ncbi:MAG: hypothetical protein GY757_39255 [bacterium]|nr:hypothetical protein [bacterium]
MKKNTHKIRVSKLEPALSMFLVIAVVAGIAVMFSGCGSPGPVDFVRHEDQCHYCKMRLNDLRFAAQVAEKGNFHRKFCAIECMFAHIMERKPEVIGSYVCDYLGTGIIEAGNAHYLISDGTPSPMGLNISAFRTAAERDRLLTEKKGKPYSYEQLAQLDVPQLFRDLQEKNMEEME